MEIQCKITISRKLEVKKMFKIAGGMFLYDLLWAGVLILFFIIIGIIDWINTK